MRCHEIVLRSSLFLACQIAVSPVDPAISQVPKPFCSGYPNPASVEDTAVQLGQFLGIAVPYHPLPDDFDDRGPVHAALAHSRLPGGALGDGKIVAWRKRHFKIFHRDACLITEAEHPDPEPGHDHFCAGHTFLPDGRLLIAGQPYGTTEGGVLVPPTESWASLYDPEGGLNPNPIVELPDMNAHLAHQERFYPSVVLKPDGKALVVGGTYWVDLDMDHMIDKDTEYHVDRVRSHQDRRPERTLDRSTQ